jgi:hypothetical protein
MSAKTKGVVTGRSSVAKAEEKDESLEENTPDEEGCNRRWDPMGAETEAQSDVRSVAVADVEVQSDVQTKAGLQTSGAVTCQSRSQRHAFCEHVADMRGKADGK